MWKQCWPERIPSILSVFDSQPIKKQRMFAYILAGMKEYATSASPKMYEVLTNQELDLETRLAAGYALASMKEEEGINPIINLLGQEHQRSELTVRAVLSQYGKQAIPNIVTALQDCSDEIRCGGLVEVLGKIKDPLCIPILDNILKEDSSEEYIRLQAMYALQTIDTKESYEKLIEYLEIAPEEEKEVVKEICLARLLISFPILIKLLNNPQVSEEYYVQIGDILAQVDATRYDKLFKKLDNPSLSQELASILKEHTPEEDEYLPIREVLDKYI